MTAREALTYVELEVHSCGLVYGSAPCQAALGVTGDNKCFNTVATCQDITNFDLKEEPEGVAAYVASAESSAPGSATVTISGVSIGAVAGDGETRSVAVGVTAWRSAGAVTLNSATIGGVAATIVIQQGSGGILAAQIWAEVPTGTTADIVCVFSAQPSEVAVSTYRLIDAEPSEETGSATTAPAPSTSAVDAVKNDSVIGVVASYLMSTTVWTGLTESVDDIVTSMRYSAAEIGFAANDDAYTVTSTQTHAARTAPTLQATFAGPRADSGPYVQFTGLATGDMLLVAISRAGGTSGTTPTDWTLLFTADNNGARIDVYRRTALWSGGTTLNVEFDSNTRDYGVGMVVRGVSNVSFIRQIEATSGTSTTSPNIPGATTDIDNTLVIDIVSRLTDIAGAQFSGWSNASLTGYGENFDNGHTQGSGAGIAVASGVKTSAGGVSAGSATLATASAYAAIRLGIAPTDNADSKIALAVAAYTWTRPVLGTTASLRFAEAANYRPQDIEAIASIQEVSVTPSRIKPGEDLGSRATVRVSFKDHPHTDTGPGLDPYYADRAYDPYEQGTFWSKFRARQPYLRGESLTLYRGFTGQSLGEMESSLFVVESFDGPTIDGVYTVIAHDPLKMLDGDRAQCPRINRGRLSADLTNSATSFTIIPSGQGNLEYEASGWINLAGKEVVSFTRSGDTFTIVRGQLGTAATTHKSGDRVQQVARFDSLDPADIIYQLMTEYADVPADWIPLDDWLAETGGYLQRVFDSTIAEPTAVSKLVAELMENAGLSIWWDELGRKVRLRVLRPITTDSEVIDERLMVKNSIGIREQPDKRFTEVWIHFGQVSPLGGETVDNYPAVSVTTNLEAEYNYGSEKIKKIYSRWIARGGRTAADRVCQNVLSRFVTPPRLFTYSLMRGAQNDPVLGGGYIVSHRSLQDATGAPVQEPVQIVSLKRGPAQFEVTAEGFSYSIDEDLGDRQVTITADMFGVNLKSLHDDSYPAPNPGDTVTCIVEAQARVGGTSSLPAFSIGTWPTQTPTGNRTSGSAVITGLSIDAEELLAPGILVTGTGIPAGTRILSVDSPSQITLTANATSGSGTSTSLTIYTVNILVVNLGLISGIGGPGGMGRSANDGDPVSADRNGGPGGTGIYSRYPFEYRDADGTTQAGGGGGAGGSCADLDNHRGGGGGGGAGFPVGEAGVGPGNGEDGMPGTVSAGGAYGRSYTSGTFWTAPSLKAGIHGGAGGDPGSAGDDDVGGYDLAGGSPGAAGVCIDGVSYLIQDGAVGTRIGSEIN